LLDVGPPSVADERPDPGVPHRGLFLLSFVVQVTEVLDRLAEMGLGGEPRIMRTRGGITASVVDPDGVTVELLGGPMSQLSG
jgi:hypothetical protein